MPSKALISLYNMEKNNTTRPTLSVTKTLTIRFSEVDSMGIVWHGSYALYFEDAREAFGANMTWTT